MLENPLPSHTQEKRIFDNGNGPSTSLCLSCWGPISTLRIIPLFIEEVAGCGEPKILLKTFTHYSCYCYYRRHALLHILPCSWQETSLDQKQRIFNHPFQLLRMGQAGVKGKTCCQSCFPPLVMNGNFYRH